MEDVEALIKARYVLFIKSKVCVTCSKTPSTLQVRASVTKAWMPPAVATSKLHLSSAARFASAPAARS